MLSKTKTTKTKNINKLLLGVSVLAVGIAFGGIIDAYPSLGVTAGIASSHAQGHGHGQNDGVTYGEDGGYASFEPFEVAMNGQGAGNQGAGGQGGDGHDGGHDDGGHDDGHEGGGRPDDRGHEGGGRPDDRGHDDGGHDDGGVDTTHDDGEEPDGRGPHYGKPDGPTGGKPAWAQEGLPEVELGRLNVARAPDHVLDRAYNEALAIFTADMAEFYSMTLDEAIAALTTDFDNLTFIDSPLQNLALLRDALDGMSVLNTLPGVTNTNDTLIAMFLGAASDKTVPISPDTAYVVAALLGTELTEAEAIALAEDAEAIREAILAGHG